jgi:hypothetical protein
MKIRFSQKIKITFFILNYNNFALNYSIFFFILFLYLRPKIKK